VLSDDGILKFKTVKELSLFVTPPPSPLAGAETLCNPRDPPKLRIAFGEIAASFTSVSETNRPPSAG
jgi:hypothetical protein